MPDVDLIRSTFAQIHDNFDFMVLRGFDKIPDQCSIQEDIDGIILDEDYDRFVVYMKGLGYAIHFDSENLIYGAKSHIHCVNTGADVHFDIVSGLFYCSTEDSNTFVGGHTELEESLWANKVEVPSCWKWNPSVEDQLTHLVCHCIFDTRSVPPKYRHVIKNMYAFSDTDRVLKLFTYAFGKAAKHLMDVIWRGQAHTLFAEYKAFKDY
jgi:hypothetical protein